jgi:electron transfer flavoprotein alpha subunit
MIEVHQLAAPESGGTKLSKTDWLDIAVWGRIDKCFQPDAETKTLLARASALARTAKVKTSLVLSGSGLLPHGRSYFKSGADRVFLYDHPSLVNDSAETDAILLAHFIPEFKPAVLLATADQRSDAAFVLLSECLRLPYVKTSCDFSLQGARDVVLSESCAGKELIESIQGHRPQLLLVTKGLFSGEWHGGELSEELIVCEIPSKVLESFEVHSGRVI